MQKIIPFLWLNNQAEEAARFYTSIFKKSKMGKITRYGDAGPGPKGSVMTVTFNLEGIEFVALNGGPHYKITPAISFVVDCKTQKEIDYYWEKLSKGGEEVQCGWLTDKFGVSWQVVPSGLGDLLTDKSPRKAKRAMEAMLQMRKLDIKQLKEAAAGK
jgi:predicted 3-demethylubiquinone-9 3-methyltransferase (glyoxalase superfamily)